MPLVKTDSHYPMSHGIKWRQVYLDWQRFQDIILLYQWREKTNTAATKTDLAKPLSQLYQLAPLVEKDAERDRIRAFIYHVFYLQFCDELDSETYPATEIKAYRQRLVQWNITSESYSQNQSSFNRYLQEYVDMPATDKHWLVTHEDERQWLILDDLFPENSDYAICRNHFKAINKLRQQLHQAALFGQVQSTLIARIQEHSAETLTTTGPDYQTNYILDVADKQVQVIETAKLTQVILHTKVWLPNQDEYSDDLAPLSAPTGSEFHLRAECKALLPLAECDSPVKREPVTLEINQPRLERLANKPTQTETLIADINKHIDDLKSGIQYNQRRHRFFPTAFTDPRHYFGGMSASEVALKKEKQQVLSAAKDLLSSQCTAETFAYVLSTNQQFQQGYFSRTRKLYQRILASLNPDDVLTIEAQLKEAKPTSPASRAPLAELEDSLYPKAFDNPETLPDPHFVSLLK